MDLLNLILKMGGKENDYMEVEKVVYVVKKNINYLNLLKGMDKIVILFGIEDFLVDFVKYGYCLFLVLVFKNLLLVLEQLGLVYYFEVWVDFVILKYGKLDLEIFVCGVEVFGLKFEECVGVEDVKVGIQLINGVGEMLIGIGDFVILMGVDVNFILMSELILVNLKVVLV